MTPAGLDLGVLETLLSSLTQVSAAKLEILSDLRWSVLCSVKASGLEKSSCASPPTGSELVRLELDWSRHNCELAGFA